MARQKENYTWSQFLAAVTALLGVDADREGVDAYRLAEIRQAVIDIQHHIPAYRNRHETVFLPADTVYEGKASKGVKPPESILRDLWLCEIQLDSNGKQTGKFRRYGLDPYPWDKRMELIKGNVTVNESRGKYTVDPNGYEFYVYPGIYDKFVLSMFWDGLKLEFGNDDETPFDEPMAGVVAKKVKAEMMREVEQNPALHQSYAQTWKELRGTLYVMKREQAI